MQKNIFSLLLSCTVWALSLSTIKAQEVSYFPVYKDSTYRRIAIQRFFESKNDEVVRSLKVVDKEGAVVLEISEEAASQARLSFDFCDILRRRYSILLTTNLQERIINLSPQDYFENDIIPQLDTTVYALDPIAQLSKNLPNRTIRSYLSDCIDSHIDINLVHIGDSIVEKNCGAKVFKKINRIWLAPFSQKIFVDQIRVCSIPVESTSHFIAQRSPSVIHSVRKDTTMDLASPFMSCAWQYNDNNDMDLASCIATEQKTSLAISWDLWAADPNANVSAIRLPSLYDQDSTLFPLHLGSYEIGCNQVLHLQMEDPPSSEGKSVRNHYSIKITEGDTTRTLGSMRQESILSDTIPPRIYFGQPSYGYTPKNSNQEYLDLYPPRPIMVLDKCSGIRSLSVKHGKQLIPFLYNEQTKGWEPKQKIRCHTGKKIKLTYIAQDNRGNTCYHPLDMDVHQYSSTVTSGRKHISLRSEKEWIGVEKLAGQIAGWHNKQVYARRLDWEDFCIDLCSDAVDDIHTQSDLNRLDPLSVLGDDHNNDAVENHYLDQIKWMLRSTRKCEQKIGKAWLNSIREYWVENCIAPNEHGHPYFHLDPKDPLGGGWCTEVPFSCDDACKEVMVEILYMDAHCRWHLDWVTVEVQAHIQGQGKLSDMGKVTISCESYNEYYQDLIEAAIEAGTSTNGIQGEQAFAQLDEALGTYQKTFYTDHYHHPTDQYGHPLAKDFEYKDKRCFKNYNIIKKWEHDHYGNRIWVYDTVWRTDYNHVSRKAQQGYIKATCDTRMEQDIWDLRDECGLGKIERRWKIYSKCNSPGWNKRPLEVKAVIEIVPGCNILHSEMMHIPKDTTVCMPQLEYTTDGNIDFGSSFPKAKIEVEKSCHSIGYAYDDQLFRLIGKEKMYKVLREHKFKSWCTGERKTIVQKIIVQLECDIPNEDNTSASRTSSLARNTTLSRSYGDHDSPDGVELWISPNPIVEGTVRITVLSPENNKNSTLVVYNSLGLKVWQEKISLEQGLRQYEIHPHHLSPGVYYLNLLEGSSMLTRAKFSVLR